MKLFGLEIRVDPALRPNEFYLKAPEKPLSEAELRLALAVPESHPLWRALHQIIDGMEADALRQAQKTVSDHGATACFLGHTEFAGMLRARLEAGRQAAFEGRSQN